MNWYKSMNCPKLAEFAEEIINLQSIKKFVSGYKFNFKYFSCERFGCINISEKVITIYVWNHDNLGQLIDTIAHEIAHIMVWEHNKEHTHIKMLLKKIIKINLEIDLDLENYGMEDEEAC